MKTSESHFFCCFLLIVSFVLASCQADVDDDDGDQAALLANPLTQCPTTFADDKNERTYSLMSEECECGLQSAAPTLIYETQGAGLLARPTDYPGFSTNHDDSGAITWRLQGHASAPDLDIVFRHEAPSGALRIDTTISLPPEAAEPILIRHYEPMRMDGDADLTLPGLGGRIHWLHNGYDSWSFTAVENIGADLGPQPHDGHILRPAGNNFNYATDRQGMGWWVGAGRVPSGRVGFVAGALSAKILKTYLGVSVPNGVDDRVDFEMVMGTPNDMLTINPGESIDLDPVFFQFSPQLPKALEGYGHRAAKVTEALTWEGEPMRGWATWYELFEDISVQDIRDHMDILAHEGFAEAGYRVLQIDDGYQKAFGDWDENEKFAIGMGTLAQEIEEAGLIPGIWIAPLLVKSDLALIDEHPDWFLHDENGGIFWNVDLVGFRKFGVLDATHPEAAEYLRSIIRRFVDAGYRYLKLDFLYPGAYEAVRYDNRLTALQAYALSCEIMREAAGDGVFLLASGEPLLPSAGHFHSARTSTDVISQPFTFTNFHIVGNIARANAARAWTAPLFSPDPDNLCIREWMTPAQARTALFSNILASGNVFLGDDLRRLEADRKSMLLDNTILDLMNLSGPMRPLDLFDEATDEFILFNYLDLLMNVSRTPVVWMRGDVLALINFESHAVVKSIPVCDLGFGHDARVSLTDLFSGGNWIFEKTITMDVQAQDARIMRINILAK